MAFSKTSFATIAGTVVLVISSGFAGGYLLATPTHTDPLNRLQRLAVEDRNTASPQVVAATTASAPMPQAQPVAAAQSQIQPVVAVEQPKQNGEKISNFAAATADITPAKTAIAAPDRTRIAQMRAADYKRAESRQIAEAQRRQRELEVATIAVRRIIHQRDYEESEAQGYADVDQQDAPPPAPRFGLFGTE